MAETYAEKALDVSLAGVPVRVTVRNAFAARSFEPFVVEGGPAAGSPAIAVRASDEDIAYEREFAPDYGQAALELSALHRQVGAAMAPLDRIVFHACVLEYEGRAYAFTAPSGTGKSTHARLWMKYLGHDARVLNGDKPFLYLPPEGGVVVYGSPWTGKEGWGYNGRAPLAGVCLIHQAPACSIERMDADDAIEPIMRQCYIPRDDPAVTVAVLRNIGRLLKRAPLWRMGCDISETAVKTSFETMTGKKYCGLDY